VKRASEGIAQKSESFSSDRFSCSLFLRVRAYLTLWSADERGRDGT
jgi:hypothetical protein